MTFITFNIHYALVFLFFTIIVAGCKDKTSENNSDAEVIIKKNRNPNIVIIYTDDLGYGDLSAYGATEIATPAIDGLADEGILFTNAYATAATCTYPLVISVLIVSPKIRFVSGCHRSYWLHLPFSPLL